jgi:tripartite-type tricarboxylate transporter receptor subunit TctC
MKLIRREFLRLAGAMLAAPDMPSIVGGQAYPSRPVHLLVGFAAGGSNDIYARLIAQWLSDRLGQPFVVENRPGGGTNIATEAVVRAAPDGHTLLLVNPANAINATLYERLNFNFLRDVIPVASMIRQPLIMVVNPSVQARTVSEFVAYAKANPRKLTMASAGTGTAPHLAAELFRMMTELDLIHVPYRGAGPALIDLLGGQVHVYFAGMAAAVDHIKGGRLRALGVTTQARADSLPDIPAIGEAVPGYQASDWFGLGAPNGTPADIVRRLNAEVNAALADPRFKARVAELGGTGVGGSPAEFHTMVADETEKWGKVIRFAGIRPD